MAFCCIPSSDDLPTLEIQVDDSSSCNCCVPKKKHKHKTHKVKNVHQRAEVELTTEKVPKLPVQHVEPED
jgi:hypothetical protein